MTNDSTAVDFGINLLEEEIDDVIFRTNEFLTDATFTGGQGPFWWILQMSMALAGLFAIIMCANMAYKMMVKREPLDVMKLFKPLAISIILCWWYPPADTGIGGGRSSWCALDFLSYIPNAIGSYTHDLYEAEAAQVEDRMADVQQLMYQLGDEASDPMSTIKAASNAVSTLLTQSSVQDVTDADAAAQDEKNIVKAEMTSTSAGLVMMIDKIIMLIALILSALVGGEPSIANRFCWVCSPFSDQYNGLFRYCQNGKEHGQNGLYAILPSISMEQCCTS